MLSPNICALCSVIFLSFNKKSFWNFQNICLLSSKWVSHKGKKEQISIETKNVSMRSKMQGLSNDISICYISINISYFIICYLLLKDWACFIISLHWQLCGRYFFMKGIRGAPSLVGFLQNFYTHHTLSWNRGLRKIS